MKIDSLLKSRTWKRLPDFIKHSIVFNSIKRIEKPFPEIGLPNCLEVCDINTVKWNGQPMYIGFTSSGITGFWDIATMSMRGVCSCMHWKNEHAKHLIGSVTDPFLGMIYLTDNKLTPYGVSIRRRSLVRMVYNDSKKSPQLLVERVYKDTGNTIPTVYVNKDPEERMFTRIFKEFLSKKINNKYEVIDPLQRQTDYHGYVEYIPMSTSANILPRSLRSMSDCNLPYAPTRGNDEFIAKFATQN